MQGPEFEREMAWCMIAAVTIGNLICIVVFSPLWY